MCDSAHLCLLPLQGCNIAPPISFIRLLLSRLHTISFMTSPLFTQLSIHPSFGRAPQPSTCRPSILSSRGHPLLLSTHPSNPSVDISQRFLQPFVLPSICSPAPPCCKTLPCPIHLSAKTHLHASLGNPYVIVPHPCLRL